MRARGGMHQDPLNAGSRRGAGRRLMQGRRRLPLWCCAFLLVSPACYLNTQRLPGPMPSVQNPLPKGSLDSYPPGPEEVLVVRHADPVLLRPAGRSSSYPLSYYRKQERTKAGSWLFVGAGGRGEVVWPNGSKLVFFGRGAGIIGSPSRSEPTFILREVTRVSVNLLEGDQIEIVGGGILSAESGPFLIEQLTPEILRIRNQSKSVGRLAFREERIELDPGNVIDLPLIASGGTPVFSDAGFGNVDGPVGQLQARGEIEIERLPGAVRFLATGEHEVRGQGVRVEVEPGESFTFLPLTGEEVEADSDPSGGPAEAPDDNDDASDADAP